MKTLFDSDERDAKTPRTAAGVVLREVRCRSVLNKAAINDYSFNCYTGCAHGCVYCYARYMQRFHPHEEPWGRFVDVKVNAPDVLVKQLRKTPPGSVFTCSACDGWQAVEKEYKLTRRCCELLLGAGFHLDVLTKSELVLRDLDVFKGRDVRLGVTITTPDEREAKLWEPRASSVAGRVRVLREAKSAGLDTTVMFGPLLPGISDTPEALEKLFTLAAETGVDRVWTDILNARPLVWPAIVEAFRRSRPDVIERCRRVLFDESFRADYTEEVHERIRAAARGAGIADRIA